MKLRKRIKKITAITLIISLLSNVIVFALEGKDSNKVIAYVDGIALTKKDVNSDGSIKDSSLNSYKPIRMPRAVVAGSGSGGSGGILLNQKYSGATVEKLLTAPSFSQTTWDIYMSVSEGRKMASKISVGDGETVATFFAGFLPKMQIPSIIALISQMNRSSVARDIRKFTDRNLKVRLRIIKSRYGTLYRVDQWGGLYLDNKLTNLKVSKERIVKITYRR